LKALLIKLTNGLHEQDVLPEERTYINDFLAKEYLTKKEDVYKFHSKYRAGTIGVIQEGRAYLHVIGENVKDLLISGDDLGDAKEGDLVIVKRLLGKRGTPSGVVSEIVGRIESYSVGYILIKEGHKSLVNLKTNHPVGVELSIEELNQYDAGDLFKINNQTNTIMEKLGNINDPKVDEKIVLAQFNKHDQFDEDVLEIASSFQEVDVSRYPHRKDLRHLPFCTIDPVTAKDFDDAIYFDDANDTLYVAIADVSEYVKPFGALDDEAMYRSFSIYFPHRSVPMLPRALSETLCSLQPNKDRLAYVFEMKIDRESLQTISAEVYEAIIHSQRRFNYDEIDDFFEKKLQAKNEAEKNIFDSLSKLKILTDALRKKRLEVGYDFRSDEIEMFLDENTNLIKTEIAKETPAHSLVEDCMLLANKAAASKYDRGLFRIHEEPSQTKLQILYQELAGIGIAVEVKQTIKETITAIQEQAKQMNLSAEVDKLIIQSQMRARYAPYNVGHFGLGFKAYTHFTSPIRRYSDLIVHRLLKAISKNDKEEGAYVLRNIESLSMAISDKEREADIVEQEFMARKFARWAQENLNKNFKARITSTNPELKATLHDEIQGAHLIPIASPQNISLFEDVIVTITKVDIPKAKIYVKIIE